MRKSFKMPSIDINLFCVENIVTASGDNAENMLKSMEKSGIQAIKANASELQKAGATIVF